MSFANTFAAGAVACGLLVSGAASAATLTTVGGDADVLPAGFSLAPSAGNVGDAIVRYDQANKTAANGLSLDERARVTFTFLGFEAGFTNDFVLTVGGDSTIFTQGSAVGSTYSAIIGPGFMPFAFLSTTLKGEFDRIDNQGVATDNIRMGVGRLTGSGATVYFDDKFTDVDYDDLVVQVDVAPIPLPAAGWMLLSALAAAGVLANKRRAA